VKQPRCEADYSPPSSAKVKNVGARPPFPTHLHGKVKVKLPLCLISEALMDLWNANKWMNGLCHEDLWGSEDIAHS
jgi:hypothetical protein